MNLFRKLCIFSILLFSFYSEATELPTQPVIQAMPTIQTSSTKTYTFKQLGWDNAVTLNGYKPVATLYIPLAKHLKIQKIVLHLDMAFSPTLTEGTRVDVRFNQNLAGNFSLPNDANQENSIDIELPLTQLAQTWQSLNFSAYLSSNKNLCDPNVWIYISAKSSLTITASDTPFMGALNQLPYPFIDTTSITPTITQFVLPQTPTMQEIFGLFQIASKLGQLAGDTKLSLLNSFLGDPISKQEDSNLILIGTSQQLLASGTEEFTAFAQNKALSEALKQEVGILFLSQSPFNPIRGLLTITGVNNQALEKALSAFLSAEFKTLSSGSLAIIDKIQLYKTRKTIGKFYESTLKELGYKDENVSGLGRHHVSYFIPLPNDRIPTRIQIKTFITAPIFNNKSPSQITLVMNGMKQSSFWLDEEHSSHSVEIDANSLKPGINKLEYLVDLHLDDKAERCSRTNYDEVWATIHSQTEFEVLFSNDFPLAMLNELPVPFNDEITAILPSQLSKEDISALTHLFFKLGKLSQLNPIHFSFRSSNDLNEEFIRNNNVIIFGTIDNNPWVRYALDHMPIQLAGNSRLLKLPHKQLQISGNSATGLVELMPSPWSDDHAVLLITGSNHEGLLNATRALIKDKMRLNLNGNIALINSDQSFEILNSYDNRYVSTKQRVMIYLRNLAQNIAYYLINYPQILIYLLVFLIPLIILRNRRK